MGSNNTTGSSGLGVSNKPGLTQLAAFAGAPQIIFAGTTESSEIPASPPGQTNTVVFPYPLPGSASDYVVSLTSVNAGDVYVSDFLESEDDTVTGFSYVSATEGSVMYLVVNAGTRPISV